MNLGTYLESLCVDIFCSGSSSVDGHMADYEMKIGNIAEEIKKQAKVDKERGGYGDYVEEITYIRELVRKECQRLEEEWEETTEDNILPVKEEKSDTSNPWLDYEEQ